jgi:DNA helicase HerA-like ATPase
MPEDDSDDNYASSKQALKMRIEGNLGRKGVFHDQEHTDLRDLLRPGHCSVVQLGGLGPRDQQTVVATLLRRAYRGRQGTIRGDVDALSEQYLPFPIFVLIEESHRFAPAGAEVISTNLLKEILAEGRKFGVGVGLVSQRPGKLDQDVLSQCMTQCIMRIVNPVDQQSVAAAVESVSRDLLDELPSLSKGQAVVTGAGVNTTVLCRVRPRHTPHGGGGTSATTEWTRYFDPTTKKNREKQEAIFPKSAREEPIDLADELFA